MPEKKEPGFSLERLTAYYQKNGISALDFNCDKYPECLASCENKDNFTKAREPYIGEKYEDPAIPRLLFVSLDPGDAPKEKIKRTMEFLREGNLKHCLKKSPSKDNLEHCPKNLPSNEHWYKTHQFTWYVFNELNRVLGQKWDIGAVYQDKGEKKFQSDEDLRKIMPFFAHTNSAKCCENKKSSSQANVMFFKNCRVYIAEEVQLFNPHILVTQGNQARNAIGDAFEPLKEENISGNNRPDFMMMEFNEGAPSLWIHHYHPRSGVYFKNNKVKFEVYAKKAAEFIKTNYPEFLASR